MMRDETGTRKGVQSWIAGKPAARQNKAAAHDAANRGGSQHVPPFCGPRVLSTGMYE